MDVGTMMIFVIVIVPIISISVIVALKALVDAFNELFK